MKSVIRLDRGNLEYRVNDNPFVSKTRSHWYEEQKVTHREKEVAVFVCHKRKSWCCNFWRCGVTQSFSRPSAWSASHRNRDVIAPHFFFRFDKVPCHTRYIDHKTPNHIQDRPYSGITQDTSFYLIHLEAGIDLYKFLEKGMEQPDRMVHVQGTTHFTDGVHC